MALVKAVVVLPEGKVAGVRDVSPPKLGDEWILVRVKAVALNPADCKSIDSGNADPGSRIGVDYAGVVEEVGSKVTRFRVGDRVAGFVNGGDSLNHDNGSFAEVIVAKEGAQFKVPDNLSFEQAATLPAGLVTCGQGLYSTLNFPLPNASSKDNSYILINGGSTATGILGIQFAKASGLRVIATASPSNWEYLKSLGAEAVFDYRSPTCGADIRAYTDNSLTYAWDCAGGGEAICALALSSTQPSTYVGITLGLKPDLLRVLNPKIGGALLTIAYEVVGEPWQFAGHYVEPNVEEAAFLTRFLDVCMDLLEKGVIRPVNPTVNKLGSGLKGVLKGLDELRAGRVSASKFVYTL